MIRTQEEASRLIQRLEKWRELLRNDAWQSEVAPRIASAVAEHTAALADRAKSPEKRGEHVEAFHLACELEKLGRVRVQEIEGELRAFAASEAVVMGRLPESL